MKTLFLCAILSVSAVMGHSATERRTPPKIHGETANGTQITLPDASAGKITLLLLGFSKQGGEQAGSWERHASEQFAHDSRFTAYTVAMLEDMPSMFRGIVRSSIRNGTPPAKREHAVTTATDEAAWKQFADVSDAKLPYLILLDAKGVVRWSAHGLWGDQLHQELTAAVQSLEAEEQASQKH